MRPSLCLLATASFFAATSVYGHPLLQHNIFNFTNPVTITTFNQSNYRIGVASGEMSIHVSLAPIPVITVENEAKPQDHERWAINPASNGYYTMHVVSFDGAVTNGSVFAVAPPPLSTPQEFAISTYQDSDAYIIEPVGQDGAWTVGENLGDQLTTQSFGGLSTQLFKIVSAASM